MHLPVNNGRLNIRAVGCQPEAKTSCEWTLASWRRIESANGLIAWFAPA
ncbi:MAG: hypothetical protein WBN57_07455 [Gammaproteobacteria bacterium]